MKSVEGEEEEEQWSRVHQMLYRFFNRLLILRLILERDSCKSLTEIANSKRGMSAWIYERVKSSLSSSLLSSSTTTPSSSSSSSSSDC